MLEQIRIIGELQPIFIKLHVPLTFDRPSSKYDNTPKNKVWDFMFQGGLSRETIETLSRLTEGSDFIEEQNFT